MASTGESLDLIFVVRTNLALHIFGQSSHLLTIHPLPLSSASLKTSSILALNSGSLLLIVFHKISRLTPKYS
jgi:hypothetical protein